MGHEIELLRKFSFDSAHSLPNVPADHKCHRLHGHTFHVEVRVTGPIGETSGWVMDFADISEIFKPILGLPQLSMKCRKWLMLTVLTL